MDHTSDEFGFSISFPEAPAVKEGQTKKGSKTLKLTSVGDSEAFIVNAVQLSKNIKPSKYESVAEKMAEAHIKKEEPISKIRSEWSCKGQKGAQYNYQKGRFHYVYRSLCYNGTAYSIIYLGNENDADTDDFFNSFSVK